MNLRFFSSILTGVLAVSLASGGHAGHVSAGAPAPGPAVVKGTVKIQGAAPKPTHIDMSQDPKCGHGAMSEEVVADSNGGLQNVVVYVSQGLGDAKFDPPKEAAEIEQKGCAYKPHVVALRTNQELKVVNDDATTHNIHPSPNNNRELNQTQPPGVPFSMTFARKEIAIPVKCNIHPWMRSYFAVFKHPFFAVSGKDGSFEIGNLPPGTYTLTAWHEKFGTAFQKITVGDSETKTIEFVFKSDSGS